MDNFMKELKEMKIWFLWQWTPDKNGKPTKTPISVNGTPTGTTMNWSHTWVTYDKAIGSVESQHAAGVGFKIPDGYFFLDADHYSLEDPFIKLILERFNSYTERSVSGGGLHIYGKCNISKLPIVYDADGKAKLDRTYYIKNPSNNLELYIGNLTNRFAVYTGDVVVPEPLKECTSAVLVTLDKNMRRAEKKRYSESRDGDKVTFDIICNLRKQKNGEKFRMLFDEGDISEYSSHSEADASLCSMIAFRAGNDAEMIDTIFRQSALYRDKWERADYREATINLGINACSGQFHRSKMAHPYFIKFNEETGLPYVSVPLLAKYTREHLDYVLTDEDVNNHDFWFNFENPNTKVQVVVFVDVMNFEFEMYLPERED